MRQAAGRTITTTLYDLISALQQQMHLADDQMIAVFVAYLLQTGQIMFHKYPRPQVPPRGLKSALQTGGQTALTL